MVEFTGKAKIDRGIVARMQDKSMGILTEVDGEWNSDTQVARIDDEIVIRTGNKLRNFHTERKILAIFTCTNCRRQSSDRI